ncbi:cucumisin-like [Cornus florida]|uniref:cucumisin-like n=1 Tax=Cornus florida TaxID=4283 RepID=UPI00289779B9|nr:cucumisin-like [Cornus florida]
MGDRPKGHLSASFLHASMLQEVVGSRASESLLYSYKRSFNGFVATLTEEEKEKIASMEGVVSVFPNENMELHTTKPWDFMGFPQRVSRRVDVESDIIVGVFDSGIWPESQSFNDTGFGPPPSKWKGSCQSSTNFTCNNKLIGAKYYYARGSIPEKDVESPRDTGGHGTHCASIAAGRLVNGASLLGLGEGTARGGVPSARIAVYKICWATGCSYADILAAFDDAIADGVDIISMSVGRSGKYTPLDYFQNPSAIGAFHAMKNGILTSFSAGNSGPAFETIRNNAPWSLAVAAGTIDRRFVTMVQLGNNMSYEGVSLNTFTLNRQYPLVYAGDVPNTQAGFNKSVSRRCKEPGSLDRTLVKDTILLCDSDSNGSEPLRAGVKGIILTAGRAKLRGGAYVLPASYLSDDQGVRQYMKSTGKPTATIKKSEGIKDELAPYVIGFSSRGPNPITRDILKPDLTAPGVQIVAAWSQATTLTQIDGDKRVVPYNIISGSSMACPHATGAAAYVKSFNPGWSPAAIKSALMTTARPMSSVINPEAEFAYGAGHIDPLKAAKPGLVYDAGVLDYVKLLCGQGYSTKSLKLVTGDNSSCSKANNGTVWDLNYPSFTLSSQSEKSITRVFHRTVTNVGSSVSTYKATVVAPAGLEIQVEPNVLTFKSLGQRQSFVVTVTATYTDNNVISGSLLWFDGVHHVRSPIVAHSSIRLENLLNLVKNGTTLDILGVLRLQVKNITFGRVNTEDEMVSRGERASRSTSSRIRLSHPIDNVIGPWNKHGTRSIVRDDVGHSCIVDDIVHSCHMAQFEPKNVDEALQNSDWLIAMQEELLQFVKNDVWKKFM